MPDSTYREWTSIAKLDLKDSECNFERGEYARSLFFLHEVSEKTFKALTLRVGFSSEDPDQVIEDALDIEQREPKKYGHFFRDKFIEQLEALFENSLVKGAVGIFGIKDVEDRLSLAKSIKAEKNPTDAEIVEAIKRSKAELSKRNEMKDVSKILKIENVEELISRLNTAFGTNVGTPEAFQIFPRLQKSVDAFPAFGPLLFLSVFLDPYYWAKYPNELNPVTIINHYEEIKKILEECIEITET